MRGDVFGLAFVFHFVSWSAFVTSAKNNPAVKDSPPVTSPISTDSLPPLAFWRLRALKSQTSVEHVIAAIYYILLEASTASLPPPLQPSLFRSSALQQSESRRPLAPVKEVGSNRQRREEKHKEGYIRSVTTISSIHKAQYTHLISRHQKISQNAPHQSNHGRHSHLPSAQRRFRNRHHPARVHNHDYLLRTNICLGKATHYARPQLHFTRLRR